MNLSDFNPSYPVQLRDLDSLILVCKAARVARLFPCTKVVQISSQVNFLWYFERLNPFWYYSRFQRYRDAAKKEMSQPQKGPGLMRRVSWGVVELAALAKVRALADERQKTKMKQLGFFSRTLERIKRCFRSIGFLPDANLELKRHVAATKIQRAWRWRLSRPMDIRSVLGLEVTSEDGEVITRVRSSRTSTVERVPKKRSMLGPYYHQHGGKAKHSFRSNSQVGSAMAEVTGQWVASIILFGLVLTMLFTYHERDATRPSTMVVLHGQFVQSSTAAMAEKALIVSRKSTIPDLYSFKGEVDTIGEQVYQFDLGFDWNRLREREKLRIIVEDSRGKIEGVFENRQEIEDQAIVELLMTIFVLLVWFLGVAAFAGPVMTVSQLAFPRCISILRQTDRISICLVGHYAYRTNGASTRHANGRPTWLPIEFKIQKVHVRGRCHCQKISMDKGGTERNGNIVSHVYDTPYWLADEGRFWKRRCGNHSPQLAARSEQQHADSQFARVYRILHLPLLRCSSVYRCY